MSEPKVDLSHDAMWAELLEPLILIQQALLSRGHDMSGVELVIPYSACRDMLSGDTAGSIGGVTITSAESVAALRRASDELAMAKTTFLRDLTRANGQ